MGTSEKGGNSHRRLSTSACQVRMVEFEIEGTNLALSCRGVTALGECISMRQVGTSTLINHLEIIDYAIGISSAKYASSNYFFLGHSK